jgi:hypothetical protein
MIHPHMVGINDPAGFYVKLSVARINNDLFLNWRIGLGRGNQPARDGGQANDGEEGAMAFMAGDSFRA